MARERNKKPHHTQPQRGKTHGYGKRPRVSLRWGRILLAFLLLACIPALFYWLPSFHKATPPSPLPPTASAPQPVAGANGTLPGDIFSDATPPGKPVLDPALAELIKKREEQAKQRAQANATQPSQEPLTAAAPPVPAPANTRKDLRILTAELATHKFIGNTPEEWGEHLAGITDHLSHVWEKHNEGQENKYGFKPQKTAAPSSAGTPTIALTLDACGGSKGSGYDVELINFLRVQRIPATLFLTTSWIKNNPTAVADLTGDPLFEIAAHGTAHKPLSINGKTVYGIKGTQSLAEILKETEENARFIEDKTGRRPRWFRAGTAYYDEIAVSVTRQLGFGIAGYSIAGDEGATLKAPQVTAKLLTAQNGDIILLHMNHPKSGTREGLMTAIPQLREKGFTFTRLSAQ